MADGRLADGSRVNVVIPPLSVDGPAVSIRRFARRSAPIPDELVAPRHASTPSCATCCGGGGGRAAT